MTIVYTDAQLGHQPGFENYDGLRVAYPEVAARAEVIIEALQQHGLGDAIKPSRFPLKHIYNVHQRQYVDYLSNKSEGLGQDDILYPSHFISDTYAPIVAGTYQAARAAVDASLTGADRILAGEKTVYTLCRPPGHHAAHHTMGGYCYFNNAAIAAEYLAVHGKVAILDIDFHHGNGTQDIFYDRSDVLYVSLHADPSLVYPYSSGYCDEKGRGKGFGYNFNYPLEQSTTDQQYLVALSNALKDVSSFKPDFLVVSAGFDTFRDDPVAGLQLTVPVYFQLGRLIAELRLRSLIVQEGGYNVEHLGEITANFLAAFNPKIR